MTRRTQNIDLVTFTKIADKTYIKEYSEYKYACWAAAELRECVESVKVIRSGGKGIVEVVDRQ